MNTNDPFGYPPSGTSAPESEETPGTWTGQPGEETDAPQSGAAAPQSFEEVCAMLLQTGIAENSFKQEMNQYRVETRVEHNNRRWTSRIHVLLNGEKMSEAGFLPNPDTRRIDAEQGAESEAKWEQFVREAASRHLEKCKQVQQRIATESSEGSGTDGVGKKIVKILLLLLVILSFLLNIGVGYLYFHPQQVQDLLGFSSPAAMPELRFEYETVRGKVGIENNMPTITLQKSDVVTIHVIDARTDQRITYDMINVGTQEE